MPRSPEQHVVRSVKSSAIVGSPPSGWCISTYPRRSTTAKPPSGHGNISTGLSSQAPFRGSSAGGDSSQHLAAPSSVSAHTRSSYPALTAANFSEWSDTDTRPQHSKPPSRAIPHVRPAPAAIWEKAVGGGLACPNSSSPQQTVSPPVRRAQAWSPPSASAVKGPSGGAARPGISSPQQTMSPNSATPQLRRVSASMEMSRASAGGVARPYLSSPQHVALPSASRAQACRLPAEMDENAPSGGGVSTAGPSPQHEIAPPIPNPQA